MILKPLSREDMEQIRVWRHEVMETLRTPYMLTAEQQADYYDKVICDRRSTTRYWGLWNDAGNTLMGYGGIENIEWENRRGELSVLIRPELRRAGFGTCAIDDFLRQAFNFLNLENVHGECYGSGPWQFWEKVLKKYNAFTTWLPNTKCWDGGWVNSFYFNIEREGWLAS